MSSDALIWIDRRLCTIDHRFWHKVWSNWNFKYSLWWLQMSWEKLYIIFQFELHWLNIPTLTMSKCCGLFPHIYIFLPIQCVFFLCLLFILIVVAMWWLWHARSKWHCCHSFTLLIHSVHQKMSAQAQHHISITCTTMSKFNFKSL